MLTYHARTLKRRKIFAIFHSLNGRWGLETARFLIDFRILEMLDPNSQ
jgi:hypothetical protein